MSVSQAPALLITIPFLAVFVIALLGLVKPKWCFPVFICALLVAVGSAAATLLLVLQNGTVQYQLGGWAPPFGIQFVIDSFNAAVLVVITAVALGTAVQAQPTIKRDCGERLPHFCSLYLLAVTGLLGMTITGDVFNLYVFLEISALSMYALIAFGRGRAYLATFNYLVMGSIGACFYLLGVGYLYIKTGSLNMQDLALILENLEGSRAVFVAFVLVVLGMWIKMALFPLHGWLPNAYHYAPNTVACLIAPLATKVSVYVMIRLIFTVFGTDYVFDRLDWSAAIGWLASIGIVAASLAALAQRDVKRMFCYMVVAEVGYMVGGVWLANQNGVAGAGFHVIADALMTFCLFAFVGILVLQRGGQKFEDMRGMFAEMPFTMAAFVVAALSMIGVPPTCGFFSKWYLVLGGIEAGQWMYVAALIFSSLVNVVLFFRLFEIAHYPAADEDHHAAGHAAQEIKEAPLGMLIPFYCGAVLLLLVGIFAGSIVNTIVIPVLQV